MFVYDTTLRVPLIFSGARLQNGVVTTPVSLVDVAPTIAAIAGLGSFDSDGVSLQPPISKSQPPAFQPPTSICGVLCAAARLRVESAADDSPRDVEIHRGAEAGLYDLASDPGEERNLVAAQAGKAAELARLVDAISPATLPASTEPQDQEARARLQALGYASGRGDGGGARPDPKDRRELAAQIARVTSGELTGAALERALRDILRARSATTRRRTCGWATC